MTTLTQKIKSLEARQEEFNKELAALKSEAEAAAEQVPEADVRESDVLKAVISLKIKLVSLCQYDAAADVRHIEKLLRAIPALPDNKAEVDGWVRVEDRLPEEGRQVLVIVIPRQPVMEGRVYGIDRRVAYGHLSRTSGVRDRLVENKGFTLAGTVTHWQPLPTAPTK